MAKTRGRKKKILFKDRYKKKRKKRKTKKPFKRMPKNTVYLPIETAVYVPSTRFKKRVSRKTYRKRVNNTRKKLTTMLGGYTSVSGKGGYLTKKGKLIKEPITKVTSFATKKDYNQNRKEYLKFLQNKKKKWNQESLGFEHEGNLYYI